MEMQRLTAEVAAARARMIAATEGLTNEQAAWKPSANEWSVAENVEHIVLAEMSGVTKIWWAIDAVRAGKPVFTGEHTNRGLSVDELIQKTWRTQETAPPIATPHMGGPLGYWIAMLKACQPVLEAACGHLGGLDPEEVIFPHFLSGPMDVLQRVEFLRFHTDRHTAQILGIRGRM